VRGGRSPAWMPAKRVPEECCGERGRARATAGAAALSGKGSAGWLVLVLGVVDRLAKRRFWD
jgi:hypothetical protein